MSSRAQRAHRSRRAVRPGFPRHEAFATAGAARAYLDQDTLQCLLCGRSLKKIGLHLQRIHGVSVEWYQMRYHLPLRVGLCGVPTREAHRAACTLQDEGGSPTPELRAEWLAAAHTFPRRRSAFHIFAATENLVHAGTEPFCRTRAPRVCVGCAATYFLPSNGRREGRKYCSQACYQRCRV